MCRCEGADEHIHGQSDQKKNLVKFIDIPKCSALNILKNDALLEDIFNENNNETLYLQSDVDDQILGI